MVIDWEHHLSTKKFAEMVKGTVAYDLQLKLAEEYPIDVQLRDMDDAGVDKAVLTGAPRWNMEECQLFNNEIAKWVEEKPDRFIGFAHAPPLGGEESLNELDRAVKDLGFKGVMFRSCIDSNSEDTSKDSALMDSPDLFPFYKKVVELDVPLFIHPAYYPLYPHAFPEPLRSRLKTIRSMNYGCGREFDLSVAIIRLVDGGVMEKFPNLKVVLSHLGGGISAIIARLWSTVGREGEARKVAEQSMEYFSKIYVDTAGFRADIDTLKFSLTKISPNRIIFGTDYPPELPYPKEIKDFIQKINSLNVSDKDKRAILEENANSLLKI